ncbi:DUF1998 domain-containing protein [Noviherbaspirillum galbum]|uniref:DUF1998 domain-containing protein n=1 Tax=Noviherbaspirillum galbum TaxID=2709383 RepID=A0A6B3SPQ6_9BURK|nr:DUF1998 domain-containing protein [Noviherbaspirillum galbum]NEX62478.1 DUF1998 domain-containing protein [Noviherbaspirillum galbum]
MGNKQIRVGQLIAPFGPGSIYTDRRGIPHVVCGLDYWFMKSDAARGMIQCEDRSEFEKFEPRLSALLRVDRFFSPPDFRAIRRGEEAPPNAALQIPAVRFPTWYRHTATGEMRKFNLDTVKLDTPPGGRWQPVRFVSVCAGGHLNEFPWKEWIGCTCVSNTGLRITDRGGADLSSIRVQCMTCPPGSSGYKGNSLSGTTVKPVPGEKSAFEEAKISCPGERPWLGQGAEECGCSHPLIGALINQTNLYFPRTVAAILLPDISQQNDDVAEVRNEIEKDTSACAIALTEWKMSEEEERRDIAFKFHRKLERRGTKVSEDIVFEALKSLFEPGYFNGNKVVSPAVPESDLLAFRRQEFNIIRNEVNDALHVPNLRVIPAVVPDRLTTVISKVNLVERLRETRAFFGFSRLEPEPLADQEMPDTAIKQLFRRPPTEIHERWLPAIEVFGEGIYIELSEERIRQWQVENSSWLTDRLDDGFITRLQAIPQVLAPSGATGRDWASRYLLVHSLAHMLINQLVFECGYSTAALRERLYVSADNSAPMAGILIYTAAGDSEGTMGGLVRLGRPDRLGPLFQRAISRASWCSADPVCSENLGGQGSRLANLAACHSCVLLPETSCETINQGLDRAMLVGTPDNRAPGLLSEFLVVRFDN